MTRERPLVTGVPEEQDIAGTLDMALALFPDTRRVLVVHDYTDSGLAVRNEAEAALAGFTERVDITYTPGESMEELQGQLADQPSDTVALLLTFVTDSRGRTFTRDESTRLIAQAGPPVFAMHETRLGSGIVGGMLLSGREHGKQAAEMALEILAGKSAADMPVARSRSVPMVDDVQLKRFHVPDSVLPPGAVVVNRPTSLYRQYRSAVWATAAIFAVQSLLIFFLVLARRRSRRAETALRESEERFRTLVDTVGEGIILQEVSGRIAQWNQAASSVFGLERDEVLGQTSTSRDWLTIHEDGSPFPGADHPSLHTLLTGEPCDGVVMGVQRPGDDTAWIKINTRPLLGPEGGKPYAVVISFSDITVQKKATLALQEAKEQAVAANLAKSEFLANMSHEIRTPLNGIQGMLQLLQITGPLPEQREYIDNAVLSSRRLTRLLSDILDLSRVEAGKMEIRQEEFQLTDIFQSVADLFRISAQHKGLRFATRIAPGVPPWLVGDAARLQQILFNLVGNALKFTDSGAVELTASRLSHPDPAGAWLLFTVTDTGAGMSDDMLGTVFEPFSQAETAYSKRHEGAGLGLAIVKRLVGLMGGNLAVASEPGKGTEVHLSLALGLPDGEPPKDAPKTAGDEAPRRWNILLAEDDLMSREALAELLERAGHRVAKAGNGMEAIDALAREPFDVVLMDVKMPVMDGSEAARRIREDTSGRFAPDVPIIAVTAYAMDGDRERFLADGMNDYVSKPVDAEELARVLNRALGKPGSSG